MTWILWLFALVAAAALSYVTQLSGATLMMGRALNGENSGTGFQDAITPPWSTNVALLVYAAILVSLVAIFWRLGIWSGLAAIPFVFISAIAIRRLLPAPTSNHFTLLILRSMSGRYADYVRIGDTVRADAMKMLLVRAGVDPDAISKA